MNCDVHQRLRREFVARMLPLVKAHAETRLRLHNERALSAQSDGPALGYTSRAGTPGGHAPRHCVRARPSEASHRRSLCMDSLSTASPRSRASRSSTWRARFTSGSADQSTRTSSTRGSRSRGSSSSAANALHVWRRAGFADQPHRTPRLSCTSRSYAEQLPRARERAVPLARRRRRPSVVLRSGTFSRRHRGWRRAARARRCRRRSTEQARTTRCSSVQRFLNLPPFPPKSWRPGGRL